MVYRAISPPATSFPRDDGDDKPVKVRFHFIAIIRFIVIILACVAFGYSVHNGNFAPVLLSILVMLLILWNFWQIVVAVVGEKGGKFHLPSFKLQIGSWHCSCGGDQDDLLPSHRDEPEPPKKRPLLPVEKLDLALSVFTLIISLIAHNDWNYRWYTQEVMFPLIWTVVALEFTIVFLSYFKVFKGVTIFVMPEEDNRDTYQYHIQLPQNVESRPTQGKGLSVQA
ncbi:hypothetical protein UCRPA7_1052 [Phaeoacremonium minimum UCRPA7]|uniref:Transmembrane protein n=1 Tax=Phaeoacremonium minimum (strain UCR-PA7) TaxID=1286976 RepID=R8BVN6_PHAM7|nr:hypothetical protein UCRPA7_1052 [Phaeoacremonium minimum UCRPA7]EOO03423.1 hypothetical protein UCRPA7_1052 [Phaeoacremonium minimum UCRPA7]